MNTSAFPSAPMARLARVRQRLPGDRIQDVAGTVRSELARPVSLARRSV